MLEHFPQRWFTDSDGDKFLMTNLCRRIAIPKEFKDNVSLFIPYVVKDGETARDIAEKLYDDHELFWVIYLVNDIHDPVDQWPLSSGELNKYMIADVGYEGLDTPYMYFDSNGNVTTIHAQRLRTNINLSDEEVISRSNLSMITFEEYNVRMNDSKRNIKLVDPDHISRFRSQIEDLMNEI